MIELQNGIKQFHMKHGFPVKLPIRVPPRRVRMMLSMSRWILRALSSRLLKFSLEDLQDREETYRIHLILEETEELARGHQEGDLKAIGDGLGDLIYVAVGDGVVYDIPCKEVVDEIHRSNMTKSVRSKTDKRLRSKGPNYQAPDIEKAIYRGRLNHAYI